MDVLDVKSSISRACTGHHLRQGWAARLAGTLRPADNGVRDRRQVPHHRLVLAARLLDPLPLADPLLRLQSKASSGCQPRHAEQQLPEELDSLRCS
jgi:hypothetical protein